MGALDRGGGRMPMFSSKLYGKCWKRQFEALFGGEQGVAWKGVMTGLLTGAEATDASVLARAVG